MKTSVVRCTVSAIAAVAASLCVVTKAVAAPVVHSAGVPPASSPVQATNRELGVHRPVLDNSDARRPMSNEALDELVRLHDWSVRDARLPLGAGAPSRPIVD